MIHLPPKVLSSSSWQVSWLSLHRTGRLPNPRRAGSVAFLASPPRSQWRGRPGFTPGSLLSSQNNTRSNNAAFLLFESVRVKCVPRRFIPVAESRLFQGETKLGRKPSNIVASEGKYFRNKGDVCRPCNNVKKSVTSSGARASPPRALAGFWSRRARAAGSTRHSLRRRRSDSR